MNERIKELVEIVISQNESEWPDFREVMTGAGALYLDVFAETFAELIVRECSSLIVKNAPRVTCKEELHLGYVSDGYIDAADLIKQRFGVKDEPKNS